MNKKKYFSKKSKYRKSKYRKTKLRGGSSAATIVRRVKNNTVSKTVSKTVGNSFRKPVILSIDKHYLLLALDLIYNGLPYNWNPSGRLSSFIGPTIEYLKITKISGITEGGSLGRGGSGKFNLDKCNFFNKENCGRDTSCKFIEDKNLCSLEGNFIICNKKCDRSKWYFLNLESINKKILCICLCWGSNFSETEFENLWENGLRENLLTVFSKEGYDQLMINGHSMGAGLAYLILIKIFEDEEMGSIIKERIKTFNNLYLHLFGMGRLPTMSVIKFEELFKIHNFNVYDIMTYDSKNEIFDSRIDGIKVNNKDCDYLSNKNPNFYCLNFSSKKINDKSKYLRRTNIKKDLPVELESKYSHCQTKEGWGEVYSEEWNNCQELLDIYHIHNKVNTYYIDGEGNLVEENKNEMSINKKIGKMDIATEDYPTGKLHAIKTYKTYFENLLK